MKKIFISIIIIISSISSSSSHVEHYSNFSILEYDLFRNDKLIGFHKYNLKRNNNELIVESSIKFKIKKLGVDLYSYAAESKEIYKFDIPNQQGSIQIPISSLIKALEN